MAFFVKDGVLQQTDLRSSPAMLLLNTLLTTGKITMKARRREGREGFLLFFNATNPDRFFFDNYGANGNEFSAIQEHDAIENDRWYELSLVIAEDHAELYLDGKKVSEARVERLPSFFATTGMRQKDGTIIVKATNYSGQPCETEVVVEGATVRVGRGRQTVYQASSLSDDNSLESPHKLVPRETDVSKNRAPQVWDALG